MVARVTSSGERRVRLTAHQQKKRLPPWWQESLYFFGCAEVRLTVLLCAGLRALHSKPTCRNRNRRRCSSNRSSARNHSWLRSSSRSCCGNGTCHGGYRKDRSSSNDGSRTNCSSSIRNRSSARSHSSSRNRSSFRSHSFAHNRSS